MSKCLPVDGGRERNFMWTKLHSYGEKLSHIFHSSKPFLCEHKGKHGMRQKRQVKSYGEAMKLRSLFVILQVGIQLSGIPRLADPQNQNLIPDQQIRRALERGSLIF